MVGDAGRESVSDQSEQSVVSAARDLSCVSQDGEESVRQSMESQRSKTDRTELAGQRQLPGDVDDSPLGEVGYRSGSRHAWRDQEQLRLTATAVAAESRSGPVLRSGRAAR